MKQRHISRKIIYIAIHHSSLIETSTPIHETPHFLHSQSKPHIHIHTKMTSKLCFLTVGATASFSALIEAAVSPAFLTALESQGYTELSVQYGQDGKQLFEKCKAVAQGTSKLTVTGFDLDKVGLARHMRRAKGGKDAAEGVVISHAGMCF